MQISLNGNEAIALYHVLKNVRPQLVMEEHPDSGYGVLHRNWAANRLSPVESIIAKLRAAEAKQKKARKKTAIQPKTAKLPA